MFASRSLPSFSLLPFFLLDARYEWVECICVYDGGPSWDASDVSEGDSTYISQCMQANEQYLSRTAEKRLREENRTPWWIISIEGTQEKEQKWPERREEMPSEKRTSLEINTDHRPILSRKKGSAILELNAKHGSPSSTSSSKQSSFESMPLVGTVGKHHPDCEQPDKEFKLDWW